MQVIRGDLEGPLHVTNHLSIHGRLRAGAIVAPNAQLVLRGLSEGDIVVEAGGNAELWGVVEGSILNRGGKVCLFGLVARDVVTTDNGTTSISSDSIVRGKQRGG